MTAQDDVFRAEAPFDLASRPSPRVAAVCADAGFDLHAFNAWWHRAEHRRHAERALTPAELADEIERYERLVALDRHDLDHPGWREEEEASLLLRLLVYEDRLEALRRQAHRLLRVRATPGVSSRPDFARARHVDLVPLAEMLTAQAARRTGDRHLLHCPLHEDWVPSLVIYPPGRGWHCFQCHEGGQDAVSFVARVRGCTQLEALRAVEQLCHLPGAA